MNPRIGITRIKIQMETISPMIWTENEVFGTVFRSKFIPSIGVLLIDDKVPNFEEVSNEDDARVVSDVERGHSDNF